MELDPQESPGEIKRIEVELDPQESPGEIKSREVELGSHRDLDNHLRVQARSRAGRWSWALTEIWTIICGSRLDQEQGGGAGLSQEVGTILCFSCFPDSVFVTAPHSC